LHLTVNLGKLFSFFENHTYPIEGPDIQITGNAGKISKQSVASDWYLSLNEESAGRFPIQFTSNDKNNYKLISCENDMVIIQNTVTKDLMCVTKDTAESMIKRNWIVKN
jgi:hypothetical protein